MKILIILSLLLSQSAFALMFKDGKVILEKLSEYNSCQGKDYTGEWCHAALEDWVDKHPDDAFEAGVMTRKIMVGHNAIPFFHKAMNSRKFDCKNEQVKLAVISGLGLPSDYDNVKPSLDIFKKCKADLMAAVDAEATPDGYVFMNVCSLLDLKGLRKAKCAEVKK